MRPGRDCSSHRKLAIACTTAGSRLQNWSLSHSCQPERPKKRQGGVSANRDKRPVAGMTPVHFGFFAVGARITQLLMLHDLVEDAVSRHLSRPTR